MPHFAVISESFLRVWRSTTKDMTKNCKFLRCLWFLVTLKSSFTNFLTPRQIRLVRLDYFQIWRSLKNMYSTFTFYSNLFTKVVLFCFFYSWLAILHSNYLMFKNFKSFHSDFSSRALIFLFASFSDSFRFHSTLLQSNFRSNFSFPRALIFLFASRGWAKINYTGPNF